MTTLRAAIAIFLKDLRSELRTRYALNALIMFVITTLSIVLFSIGQESVQPDVLCGLLWIIIFFSAMSGLSRTFVSEEERGTTMTLHLVARPVAVYVGKLLFNLALLSFINLLSVGLFLILISSFVIQSYTVFALTVFLGHQGQCRGARAHRYGNDQGCSRAENQGDNPHGAHWQAGGGGKGSALSLLR